MEARGKWIHIQGNTWCIKLRVMIPVFLCGNGDAILLDSGYAEDRAELLRLLAEKTCVSGQSLVAMHIVTTVEIMRGFRKTARRRS